MLASSQLTEGPLVLAEGGLFWNHEIEVQS